jgi:Chemotaxis protein histidine kinase and related kinases
MIETIAKLVRIVPAFSVNENGGTINEYFEQNKESEGVVIVDGERPVGIVMRNNFYQKIGKQFGYSLYMRRDVTLIMKTDITCIDKDCDMAGFGFIAMNRKQDSIYDFIVVQENEKYAGIVSISEFLMEMSRTKEREIELLNDQQRILKQANEVEKLHRIEIEHKNAAIKNLLDHAGQGFLFFGSDLIISEEYSRECDAIFGFPIGNMSFLEVMTHCVDDCCVSIMKDVFQNVFLDEDKIRNKVYLSVLPEEIRIGRRYIQTEYKVIPARAEKSVMMILTDITERKALELKTLEEKNNIKLIIRAISSKSEIDQAIEELRDFICREARQLVERSPNPMIALQNIFRIVHTMKGDFSLNSLHHTSAGLHRLEDALSLMQKDIDTVSMDEIHKFINQIDCDRLIEHDLAIIKDALGPLYFEKEDTYAVSRQRITEIENKIRTVFPGNEQTEAMSLFRSLFFINVKDLIKNYNDYVKTLGERFGKNIRDIQISGEDVYLNRNIYAPFIKSLVHVFRNMADHGIEEPEERAAAGKPECGEISCSLEKIGSRFILSLTDDGRGIDEEAIKKKALEKKIFAVEGIERLSRDEILKTIFLDDFSTRSTVDLYSGRGVGLAAVYAETEKLGGKVGIETEAGKYSCFKFALPLHE